MIYWDPCKAVKYITVTLHFQSSGSLAIVVTSLTQVSQASYLTMLNGSEWAKFLKWGFDTHEGCNAWWSTLTNVCTPLWRTSQWFCGALYSDACYIANDIYSWEFEQHYQMIDSLYSGRVNIPNRAYVFFNTKKLHSDDESVPGPGTWSAMWALTSGGGVGRVVLGHGTWHPEREYAHIDSRLMKMA